jgi:serine/threonine protein kinase
MARRIAKPGRRSRSVSPSGLPIIDGFRVERQIGEGGFSQVYRCAQEAPRRPAAIKVFRASGGVGARVRERFERESSVIGELSSLDGLVTVFTGGFTLAGEPYLAMELCEGGSMSEYVAHHGQLKLHDAVAIGVRIGSALASVHARGISHRDVKPSNILLSADGRALLTDFGLASMGELAEEFGDESRVAMTEVYAAPERLNPSDDTSRALDIAGDQYSFAVTLYAMLLGATPFSGETTTARVLKVLSGEREPLKRSDVPSEVLDVLIRAMEPTPSNRWASMTEMVTALATSARESPPSSTQDLDNLGQWASQLPNGLRPSPLPSMPQTSTKSTHGLSPDLRVFLVPDPQADPKAHRLPEIAPEPIIRPGTTEAEGAASHYPATEALTASVFEYKKRYSSIQRPGWQRRLTVGVVVAICTFIAVFAGVALLDPSNSDPALVALPPLTSQGAAIETTTSSVGTTSITQATAQTSQTASTLGLSPRSFFDELTPNWAATNVDNAGWDIEVTFLEGDHQLGDTIATVKYPGHGCSGEWALNESTATELVIQESIQINPDMVCATSPTIELTRTAIDRIYYHASGMNVDAATTLLSPS